MKVLAAFALAVAFVVSVDAAVDGAIKGRVLGPLRAPVSATVRLFDESGKVVRTTASGADGAFFFPALDFGTYVLSLDAPGFEADRSDATVGSGQMLSVERTLKKNAPNAPDYVVSVKSKRRLVQATSSGSKTDLDKDQIKALPGGENISLPKLLSSTTPGVVQGPFGQMFIRGNHANIQYQIDGVQLPDSMSGTFGDAFSPRNIDHMEVITGGASAEYGERLAAVMNIVTKSGPEKPNGSAEMNFGSYNTFNPQASYGGTSESGRLRYFVTANYLQTDRGLDTPQPANYGDQSHGGKEAVHDHATGNDEFARLDYVLDDADKFTLNLFNSQRTFQIPNFPSSFSGLDPYFGASSQDQFGNVGQHNWTPSTAGNEQAEQNAYVELVWKKTLSDASSLQIAPYYKRSALRFMSDAANDLPPIAVIANGTPSSLNMNRSVDNWGLKTDYTRRVGDDHLIKAGFQAQESNGAGSFSVQTDVTQPATAYGTPDNGWMEAIYVQDSWSINKSWTLNVGARLTETQFNTEGLSSQDGLLQPRIGLEYLATETTKLHLFYGKLFQPAPFEDLRDAFSSSGAGGPVSPYDVKAEKDDYYEVGVAQQLGDDHLARLTSYYKDATNMLDDQQLLNTSIAQPYNFSHGFAAGVEFSIAGRLGPRWQDFFNYAYEDARGQGVGGGAFTGRDPNAPSQFLDHVQLSTANAGLTYKADAFWSTLQALYGSGLRTGYNNGGALPGHATFDYTIGYGFRGEDGPSKWRVSADVLNILDNAYPITIANGFNGNHYAAGRQFFVRLAKSF